MSIKTSLTHNGFLIERESLTKNQLKQIISDLTVIPYRLDATRDEMEASKFALYRYSDCNKHIIVPRYYGISKFGNPKEISFQPEQIELNFTQELRNKQKIVTAKCIKYMMKHGGGLLSVPCGFGKTVCALYIAHRLGLKTLVVVHKSFLLKQWIDRAKEFLGISDDRIGIIRQKVCDIENKDIVIGMIQTISKKEYKNVFIQFGLVIYDEAHHVASRFYSKSLFKTCAQYTLSLTATPYRGDGLIRIMYWFAGGTIYREKMKINKNVIVKMIHFKSTNKKLFALKKKWLKGKIRPDTGKMTTNICNIDSRNNKMIDMITHIRRSDPERKILILSGRKSHLEILKNGVDLEIESDVNKGIIDKDEICSCYYTGDTTPANRQIAEERGDIIFATFAMANEGLDIKHLNTVILASPKKDVVQSIGRIMRTILQSGSIRPMIIDFADDINAIGNWINVRNIVYKKCKYVVENYYLIDEQFKTSLEYNGLELTNEDIHHKDSYLNTIINNFNKDINSFKNDINVFRDLYSFKNNNNHNDKNYSLSDPNNNNNNINKYDVIDDLYYPEYENKEFIVLDDLEYTNINDILFVDKLTENDFDIKLIKDAENAELINLEEDMKSDDSDDDEIAINLLDLKQKKHSDIPSKKLFK